MDVQARKKFNALFSENQYDSLLNYFPDKYGIKVPFRIAETPIFLPPSFKNQLVQVGEEILNLLLSPSLLEYSLKGIPDSLFVSGDMGNPNFLALDFGICADDYGEPVPRLIELQGFPSLYAFQYEIGRAYHSIFNISPNWNQYFKAMNEESYLKILQNCILGDHSPEEVILLEIDPRKQSTAIDFAITQKLFGIAVVSMEDLIVDKGLIFYRSEGKIKPVKRIYNRVIFDELQRKNLNLNYRFQDIEPIEWAIHPNWFFRWSKFLMPRLDHPCIPSTYYLKDLKKIPDNLENYVLKPLFSFSGEGVIFNLDIRDLEKTQDKENFILQKKVTYLPIIQSPDGGVKAEIRLLYLWDRHTKKPELVTNLCRLSRGDMIGVKFNKEKTWVGGSVALFE